MDQRFAENEGVMTTESATDKTEVVSTAESPNQRSSRDEREIRRNVRNPTGHMANEGDEIKFNSISTQPSILNI